MDDDARRRRQEPHNPSSSNARYAPNDPNAPRRPYGGGTFDRFRPAPPNASPSAGRGMGGAGSYNAYYNEASPGFSQAMPQSTIAYPPAYTQDGRSTQGYGPYNTSMLYSVAQGGSQGAVYETSHPFPSRQAAGLQMMSADVPGPYFQGESSNPAAAAGLQPQTGSSTPSAVYQQNSTDQRMLQQSYPGSVTPLGGIHQTSAPSQAALEEEDNTQSGEMGQAYAEYQTALKEIFKNIHNGVLKTAGESLLDVSEWLLTNVAELGLNADDESLLENRLRLWKNFNYAWLALAQKQKEMLLAGHPSQQGQTLITEEYLKKLGNELVHLCNLIERHGLVDYECGVWEERILDVLLECFDIYESRRTDAISAPTNASRASHPSNRRSR